ncbi:hypothetical protein [Actinomadura rubrobrunea]|uniref:hypothetical protein n=1 Tax=Actinomadura rubrobrunea TaxID=115335 RepID=UPI0011B1EC25|nr:hypothetical protein [Actinomadura rubrobrunea]
MFDDPAEPAKEPRAAGDAPSSTAPADQQPSPDAPAAADKPQPAPKEAANADTAAKTSGPTDQPTPQPVAASDSPPSAAEPAKPKADQPPSNVGESNTNVSDQSRDVIDPGKTGPDDAAEDPAQHADAKPPVGDADAPESEDEPTPLTEPDAQRPEPATTENERGSEQPPASNDAPRRIELKVDGRPIREYLDPVGAYGGWGEVGDQVPDPTDRTGDRIAKSENDKQSRSDAFRRAFHREGERLVDRAGKTAGKIQDMLKGRPPTGKTEVRTGDHIVSAPHLGLDAANVVTSALVAGVLAGEGIRWVRKKVRSRKVG